MISYGGCWSVYVHTNKTNSKTYVGVTSRPVERRWRSGKGYRTGAFHNAIEKYGWDGFDHDIIASGLNEQQAKHMEIILINLLHSNDNHYGYNLTLGGDGCTGLKQSAEFVEKMKQLWQTESYRNNVISKLSANSSSMWSNESYVRKEIRAHNSAHHKMVMSEKVKEARAQIPWSTKSNGNRIANKRTNGRVRVRCVENDMVFDSLTSAAMFAKVSVACISMAINGKAKSTGGYHWQKID